MDKVGSYLSSPATQEFKQVLDSYISWWIAHGQQSYNIFSK